MAIQAGSVKRAVDGSGTNINTLYDSTNDKDTQAFAPVDQNGAAYGVKHTSNEPHVLVKNTSNIPVGAQLKDENGVTYGIKHVSNKPRVSAMPYTYDIAEGNISQHYAIHRNGYFEGVGVAFQDLVETGDTVLKVPDGYTGSAIALEIQSDSAQDGVGGTGALTVEVHGLDANYQEQNETATMNGASSVALTGTWRRVTSMHVRTSGTDFKANGNITVENVGNTEVYCKITAGNGSSLHGHYCVPAKDEAGETMFAGYLISWSASLSNSGNRTNGRIILACSCDIEAQVVTPGIYQFFDIMTADSGGYHRQFDLPLKLPVQTDIKLIAEKIGGTGVVDAAGSFNLWFEG